MYSRVIDFIRQTFHQTEGVVPLHAPCFIECIDSTFVSSVGKFVDCFEEMVAEYTGAKRAVVCVNGTNSLHMAMLLSGVVCCNMLRHAPLHCSQATSSPPAGTSPACHSPHQ